MVAQPENRWIVAGNYAIDADSVLYINTSARFMGPPKGDDVRDAWGEVPPSRLVEHTGVEIVWSWMREQPPCGFSTARPRPKTFGRS